MTIFKFPLAITDEQTVLIGDPNAKALHVEEQDGILMLWALLDRDYMTGHRKMFVQIVGTGHEFRPQGDYVGTAKMSNGLVWHVFAD